MGEQATIRRVLVTGATGYVGGRLVPVLLAAGFAVRCLARTPSKLRDRAWFDDVEVVEGDATVPADVRTALDGCDAAYYLMHSMDGVGDFEERDRRMAELFRDAAADAGVAQLVYLGGLGDDTGDELSPHLASRHEVGRILAEGPVPVTELRAAVVIGSGSASFEMLRHLVDVLPAMITPRWVQTRCQPIAIRDVLGYLVGVLDEPEARGRILEVGGPEVMTYQEMMEHYARIAGLRKRLIINVPFLTPRSSAHWVNLVTPIPRGLATPLIQSLKHDVVVTSRDVDDVVPRECLTFDEAVEVALRRVKDLAVPTTWTAASSPGRKHAEPLPEDPEWSGGTILEDEQVVAVDATPEVLFQTVQGIGGERGYYVADVLWGIRGLIDTVLGGVGKARGRRHPDQISEGEALDWWRVETIEAPHLLRLVAEMRLPGEAWLEFHVQEREGGGATLVQRARYHPRGVWGRAYWYALVPFHAVIFPTMARRIAAAAEAADATTETAARRSAAAA